MTRVDVGEGEGVGVNVGVDVGVVLGVLVDVGVGVPVGTGVSVGVGVGWNVGVGVIRLRAVLIWATHVGFAVVNHPSAPKSAPDPVNRPRNTNRAIQAATRTARQPNVRFCARDNTVSPD